MDEVIRRHPLQRLKSPSLGVSALIHVVGIACSAASFKYLVDNPTLANESYGWHFQYLTILGLFLATLTFTTGLLADITDSPQLFLVKNILSMCSAPMEVLISVLWWTISSASHLLHCFRGIANPYRLTVVWFYQVGLSCLFMQVEYYLGFHAIPSLILTIDLLFLSPPWTISIIPAMSISGCIAFGYWFWVELCYQYNGWYPYPMFDLLDTKGRIGLFALSATIMAMVTITLKWLYGRVNGFGTQSPATARPGAVKK